MSSNRLRVLGLVPARGGSKGVPRKNVRLLHGRPLLHYTADAALAAARLAHVALSTDDEEVAAVGRACGLDVPFMRPPALATDAAPMLPVVQHALRWFDERGARFDAVCLLQPTNPLRRAASIDACIDLLSSSEADSVVTVLPVPAEYNPHWVYFRSTDGSMRLSTGEAAPIARRQDLPAAFHREGSVYVSRRETVLAGSLYGRRTIGHLVDAVDSVNIDEPSDWDLAEARLAARLHPPDHHGPR
jgi:CMP-N,N'-diacetyllegionaminic acid synthase